MSDFLNWEGKEDAFLNAFTKVNSYLLEQEAFSIDGDNTKNLYIEGDNLEAMKLLLPLYEGKIKIIYIDPPYNKGRNLIYNDSYPQKKSNHKEDSSGEVHSAWLSMMYPRLILAKKLLCDDGVIFISIDDKELAHLKLLCDLVFGEDNFVEIFSWVKTATPPALSAKSRKTVEYILAYEKNKDGEKYKGEPLDNKDQPLLNRGNKLKTLYFPKEKVFFTLPDGIYKAGKYERTTLEEDITVLKGRSDRDIVLTGEFKWTQETVEKEIKDGTVFYLRSKKFSIRFLRRDRGEYKTPTNMLKDKYCSSVLSLAEGISTNESAGEELRELLGGSYFDFPKPLSLIKHIVGFKSSGNDVILDFFSGSGTTAHAVLERNLANIENNQFILVQAAEPCPQNSKAFKNGYMTIADIGRERVKKAISKIKNENPGYKGDLGFKAFKITSL